MEDEKIWINERLTRARVPNYGNSLLSVQMLLGKNRSLRNEVDSHEPTIISVVDLGLSMIEEGHPQSDEFQQQINELNSLWAELQKAVDEQKSRIELSEVAQQVSTQVACLEICYGGIWQRYFFYINLGLCPSLSD